MRILLVAAIVTLAVNTAAADAEISGFVTTGPGDLIGRVIGTDGKPRKKTAVHIVGKGVAEQIVTTDDNGNYRAKIANSGMTYVYAEGTVKIDGQSSVAVKEGDTEAIAIREAIPPAIKAKPTAYPWVVPEYSSLADDKDTWTRAWLMIHVSDTGRVLRLKLINKPGMDLDAIAIRDAFKLTFEPARDRANRKIPSMILWTYEWPSSYWWNDHQDPQAPDHLPPEATLVQCRVRAEAHRLRDCSKPNIANAVTMPWIEAPKKK